jgi:hypothetical protein
MVMLGRHGYVTGPSPLGTTSQWEDVGVSTLIVGRTI